MHGLLWWIVVGLVAGVLAKALMPGTAKEPKGCLMTMVLGIVGSLIMGFLVSTFMGGGGGGLIPSIVGATLGAMLVIFASRKLWA
jgi:uncharacterized membrane protein YeaQ/YmgE (transglycosylase-associated protein family)